MMSEAIKTTDHDTIRGWVERRGGRPARVEQTASGAKDGILRIDFGEPEEALEEISWDDFFAIFERSELALLIQEETSDGSKSYFSKFVDRRS